MNGTDIHAMSNKLRLNNEQHKTCRLGLHAWQCNSDYVKTLVLSVHPKGRCLCASGDIEILEAEVAGISRQVNNFRSHDPEKNQHAIPSKQRLTSRKAMIFFTVITFSPFQFAVKLPLTSASAKRAVIQYLHNTILGPIYENWSMVKLKFLEVIT